MEEAREMLRELEVEGMKDTPMYLREKEEKKAQVHFEAREGRNSVQARNSVQQEETNIFIKTLDCLAFPEEHIRLPTKEELASIRTAFENSLPTHEQLVEIKGKLEEGIETGNIIDILAFPERYFTASSEANPSVKIEGRSILDDERETDVFDDTLSVMTQEEAVDEAIAVLENKREQDLLDSIFSQVENLVGLTK